MSNNVKQCLKFHFQGALSRKTERLYEARSTNTALLSELFQSGIFWAGTFGQIGIPSLVRNCSSARPSVRPAGMPIAMFVCDNDYTACVFALHFGLLLLRFCFPLRQSHVPNIFFRFLFSLIINY